MGEGAIRDTGRTWGRGAAKKTCSDVQILPQGPTSKAQGVSFGLGQEREDVGGGRMWSPLSLEERL